MDAMVGDFIGYSLGIERNKASTISYDPANERGSVPGTNRMRNLLYPRTIRHPLGSEPKGI